MRQMRSLRTTFGPKPRGYQPPVKPHRLPPQSPSAIEVIRAGIERRIADGPVGRLVRLSVQRHPYINGHYASRCEIAPTARINNVSINASCGIVRIGEYALFGPGVSIVCGTHLVDAVGEARITAVTIDGCDVTIGEGVFIATNAIVVGPCVIGDNAVVCAGAVVTKDVPAMAIVAGVPATVLRYVNPRG